MLRLCASPCDLSLHSFSSSRLPSPAGYSEFLTWWLKVLRWSRQKLPGLRSPRMSLSPHSVSQRPDSKARTNYFFFYFIFFLFIYWAVLVLRFCARASPSRGKRGSLFIAVRGPLTIAASLVAEHRLQTRRLQTRRLSNCGSRA